ncbi:MAG TPA: mechanosensitive ion channel domain-containing protein [Terriglobia bacterium]|nr:mechanosensitive ion channel domain-containing protein [Terriglobia bacterium]
MKASPKFTLIILLMLSGMVATGLFFNARQPSGEIPAPSAPLPESGKVPEVDQGSLQTARELSALAAGPQERQLAQDAERVADHEVDLAFDSALRTANDEPPRETRETQDIEKRLHQAEAAVDAGQAKLKELTAEAKSAQFDRQQALQQQTELVQAELQLDQDEAADAQEDLVRAGGDARGRLQRLLQEHEAGEHENGSVRLDSPSGSRPEAAGSNLMAQWGAWNGSRNKRALLANAQNDALARASALSRIHDALEAHVRGERSRTKPATETSVSSSISGEPADSAEDASATLVSLRHLSDDKKNLAGLDKRIEDLKQLGAIYGQWKSLVGVQARVIGRSLLNSILWIVLAVLLVLVLRTLIDRFVVHLGLERKQQLTLQALLRFAVEALAVVAVLLVVFGTPSQLSTILGLAGAGLTVVLKDFIVSFLGWFVLMGRNGIRVGDWVEINGVRGEVVEIGLLRTVLLETGNWADAGQPTGRQVAFLNSYAVEGYYFNFTTSGQWLWDEIQVLIPPGENPYPVVEKVHAIVSKETESNVQLAEQEWQRVTRRYGVRPLSPLATVDMKPTASGVQVTVRYMVRAVERSEVRSRLNHAVVELLHGGKAAPTLPEPVAASQVPS